MCVVTVRDLRCCALWRRPATDRYILVVIKNRHLLQLYPVVPRAQLICLGIWEFFEYVITRRLVSVSVDASDSSDSSDNQGSRPPKSITGYGAWLAPDLDKSDND